VSEPTYAWEVADDYETRIQAAEDKAGSLAADLIEERAQRREVGEALVRVTEERDEALNQLSDMADRIMDEGWKQVGYDIERQYRYKLAWKSARDRAASWKLRRSLIAEQLKRTVAERDEARDEVVRLGREGEELLAALMEANNNRMALVVQHIKALAEIKRLRTIIGELGAAEAAEPQEQIETLRPEDST
jgi:hypothetical protein